MTSSSAASSIFSTTWKHFRPFFFFFFFELAANCCSKPPAQITRHQNVTALYLNADAQPWQFWSPPLITQQATSNMLSTKKKKLLDKYFTHFFRNLKKLYRRCIQAFSSTDTKRSDAGTELVLFNLRPLANFPSTSTDWFDSADRRNN